MKVSELIEVLPGATPVTVQSIHVGAKTGSSIRAEFDGTATEAVRANQQDHRLDELRVIEATVRGLPAGNGIMTIIAMEENEDDIGGDTEI